ncbi:PIP5K3, partial [Symbiodinium microadriaticum]
NQPHGLGVKFYSDGTVYHGPWHAGYQKTDVKGTWIRPDGSQYEGTWLQGRKHGSGRQIYSDETVYEGQFANGFEHGHGRRTYTDGSSFEGRFRFGRRDGPGVLTTASGQVQKGTFRDALMTHEKPPPPVFESDREITDPTATVYSPPSLLSLSVDQIALALIRRADIYPPSRVQRRASDHMKPMIGEAYMRALGTIADDYMSAGKEVAFRLSETITHDRVRLGLADMEAFLYLQGANSALTALRLTTNKMDSPAVESLGRLLPTRCWPKLTHLDLSYNSMDHRALNTLTDGVGRTPTITVFKLAACKINHTTSSVISALLCNDTHLLEMDLSFNILGSKGAEDIAKALKKNRTLKSLNLRQNNLGPVGGMLVVDSLIVNKHIETLSLADNKCGDQVISLLAGRLRGNLSHLMDSVKFREYNDVLLFFTYVLKTVTFRNR